MRERERFFVHTYTHTYIHSKTHTWQCNTVSILAFFKLACRKSCQTGTLETGNAGRQTLSKLAPLANWHSAHVGRLAFNKMASGILTC